MTKPKYIQLIDDSVAATKDYLARHELLHYMTDPDKQEIDGTRAEKDGIKPHQVYELSSYSTLIETKEMLHKLWKGEDPKPITLGEPETEADDILSDILAQAKEKKRTNITVIGRDKLDSKAKTELKAALKEILKDLEEE